MVTIAAIAGMLVALVVTGSGASPVGADGNEAPGAPAPFRGLSAGRDHTCATVDGGQIKCWGNNFDGQLGLGDTSSRGGRPSDSLPLVDLGTGRTATAISAGTYMTCALLDTSQVKCWGWSFSGGLGLGDTKRRGDEPGEMGDNLPAVDLGTGRTATAITAGGIYVCALLDNGTVKCWGNNSDGQLGLGDTNSRGDEPGEMGDNLPAVDLGTGRTATAIIAGGAHTCALLDNGQVKCWGLNNNGELGLSGSRRGDEPGEMGDNLPAVDLGTGRTATAITAGETHTCALLDNSQVKCWGSNGSGQLGLGDTSQRGYEPSQMGDNLPAVDLGTGRTATGITARAAHTCALLDNSQVKCWGSNGSGELGLGDTSSRGNEPGEMGDNLPAVDLGTGRTATAITAGGERFTCARLDNDQVKCWGSSGQLGLGDTNSRGDEPGEMGDNLPAVDLDDGLVVGTVTDAASGAPVAGAWVAVLDSSDYSIAGGAVADGSGNYIAGADPGSYYLYLIDPAAAHAVGFFGPPAPVTVVSNEVTTVDPTMASLRGTVTGTVTEAVSGTPIAGAWALSLSTATASTGATEAVVAADGSGSFDLAGLGAGSHYLGIVDPTGAHAPRFWPDSPNVPDATPVSVTAGAATTADVVLPTQAVAGTGALISGTITASYLDDGGPRFGAGARVVALRASDFALVRGAAADNLGRYSLNVPPGDYKLAFLDADGLHQMEWYNDQPSTGLADAATVTAPARANAVLDSTTGVLQGAVTDELTGHPIMDAWVVVVGPTGIAGGTVTSGNEINYVIGDLPQGTYRALFIDPYGGRAQEYFDNSPDYLGATAFAVAADDITLIDAVLALP